MHSHAHSKISLAEEIFHRLVSLDALVELADEGDLLELHERIRFDGQGQFVNVLKLAHTALPPVPAAVASEEGK